MNAVKNILSQFNHRLFESVTRNRLIYNSCWEDPKIDRALLQINADSQIVMLTSAGCNALAYLLDRPGRIYSVDINPAQNAVLELKRALFLHGDYSLLWQFFGRGRHPSAHRPYRRHLRIHLSPPARAFWDQHIDYFIPSATASSYYFRGTSGALANIVYKRIRHKGLYSNVLDLLDARSLSGQQYYFEEIAPHLWNAFSRWLLRRSATMALLGVPDGQRQMIEDEGDGGLTDFIQQSVREVFTRRPIRHNYFWRVYLTGHYTPGCRPSYLAEKNFSAINQSIDRLSINTGYLTQFLKDNPGRYTHFVLLDHQDWMARRSPRALREEWQQILANAAPGARVLFRSAGPGRSFLPEGVRPHLSFDDEQCRTLHATDRVGTYGSTHLGIVEQPL